MPLEFVIDKMPAVDVVTLRGRIDSAAAPAFGGALKEMIAAGSRRVVLDCAELRYVSSAGLAVFCECGNLLGEDGGSLGFAALTPHVRNVFEISGLFGLFPVYASREEALEA